MDFVDQTLTQAEKDEIERLQRELTSTKRNLQELEEREAAVAFELDGAGHDPTGHLGPDFGGPIPPAEIEMVRAAVIHENKTKYNFESLRTIEGKSRVESVAENFLKPYYAVNFDPISSYFEFVFFYIFNYLLALFSYDFEQPCSPGSVGCD